MKTRFNISRVSRASLIRLALTCAVLALPVLALACPMCKESLTTTNPAGQAVPNELAKGFYYSILLMFCAPYLLVGGFAFFLVRAYRRHGRAIAAASETSA